MNYIFLFFFLFFICACHHEAEQYKVTDGFAQGTTYHIIYKDSLHRDLQPSIDSLLKKFDKSLSVYDSLSIISRMNRNEEVEADDYFIAAFQRSKEVYENSAGAFDISASPFFNAWGFGFKDKEKITPHLLDSLKAFVGMDKVWMDGRHLIKSDPRITLNMNAIAQGYSVDIVSEWFESMGIENYLVEIGGEIYCKGRNKKGDDWAVAIDRPDDGNMIAGESIQIVLHFTDRAMVTSGNYRKFYMEDGEKYPHTINPATGRPVTHNLLSATVFAEDAITADAYATTFMVMGLEKAKEILRQRPQWGAYLIYDEDGEMRVFMTDDVKKMVRP
jgi:thiamine biosynthesis lipoprotein